MIQSTHGYGLHRDLDYLRLKPSSELITAARQLLTHRWWNEERGKYDLVVSQYVIDEASEGDPVLAAERLQALDGIPLLPPDPAIPELAKEIMAVGALPPKAQIDALHIAAVAHHRIQYLLTWNCKHLANARILPKIQAVLSRLGVWIPIICTPEELPGDE